METAEEAIQVAAMSEGSITLAQQLLNADLRALREMVNGQLEQLEQMQPLEVSKHVCDQLEKISSGTEDQRRNAKWLLRFIAGFLNDRLRRLTSGDFSDPLLQRFGVSSGVDLLAPLLIGSSSQLIRSKEIPL